MISTLQAERAVAGSILTDTKGIFWPAIRGFLRPADFQDTACRSVYAAACQLMDDGEAVDAVTVSRRAGIDNELAMQLLEITPTSRNVVEYGRLVHNGAMLRKLAELGENLTEQAIEGGADAAEIITDAAAKLDALTAESSANDVLDAGGVAERFLQQRESTEGELLHSFPSIDALIGGLAPGRLYIVGARPAIGKTAFSIAQAAMLAKQVPTLYVSLEMEPTELAARVIGSYAGLSYSRLLNGRQLTDEEEKRIAEAAARFNRLHLYINMAPSATVAQIGIWAREVGAKCVYIDHIGLIRGNDPKQSEYERTTSISGDLKRLARALHVPIVGECQLNRASVSTPKDDARPRLHNLRASGAIEQDADAVALLHREDYYRPPAERVKPGEPQLFEIDVAKNRHGKTGVVGLTWFPQTNRFVDEIKGERHGWHVNSWT